MSNYCTMIPFNERIEPDKGKSFYVGTYSSKYFERSWHYHHEYELLLITKGYGTRRVGNNSSRFAVGDLVLIGGNLPHAWFSDPIFFDPGNNERCESIYIQFDRSIFGTRFAGLPEMQAIQSLLNEAKYGLVHLPDEHSPDIINLICDFPRYTGVERLLALIRVLDLFKNRHYKPIVSQSYFENAFITKSERIKKVHEYVMNNYMADVSVDKAAELAGMNVSSFCRYFKKTMQKTFSQFVKEIRVDFAQQLLINTVLDSNQIGFECGYSSISYFNQCFKSISGISPLEYRANFKKV